MPAPFPAEEIVERLRNHPDWRERTVHIERLPPRAARYGDLDLPLPLSRLLASRGIARLYTHQAEAIRSIRAGAHTAVTTPTASGKSLVYLLAAWERKLSGPPGHALYLSPLKALAQDQRRLVEEMGAAMAPPHRLAAALYDGDTPTARRAKLRAAPPDLLLTNPDMVHLSVLASHGAWRGFLGGLTHVILDEAHAYRGVFGSHVASILRRLKRVCARYGSSPVFVTTSATLGNPDEFLRRLTGEAFTVVSDSGAPTPVRWFALIKPRANAYTETCELLALMLKAGLKTITFTKARKITELLSIWLAERAPALADRVRAYRAGYLPEERRELERALASDELAGIISTSALELGIDIGGLDGCLLTGFPGTMLSTWQRAGRVGRGDQPALIALVGMDDALDLYFLSHPAEFFSRPPERLLLDEANPAVLKAHLACAAAEEPLTARDARWFGPTLERRIAELLADGRLFEAAEERRWFCPLKSPQRHVNIRSAGESFLIEDGVGKLLGTVDGIRVFRECHPHAIYLHAGETWEVVRLDTDARRVTVRPVTVDHYTQAVATETTRVLAVRGERPFGPGRLAWGDVRVTTRIVEYERKRVRGGETLSKHPLDLPPQEFETTAVWLIVPDGTTRPVQAAGRHLMGALHALEHVSIALFPLFALCDRWDLGGISTTEHPDTGQATIFIYDGMPGGVGLAELAYGIMEELQRTVAAHLAACPCENGCPSCVHSPKCGSRNYPLDKVGALMLANEFASLVAESGRALVAVGSAVPGVEEGRAGPLGVVNGTRLAAGPTSLEPPRPPALGDGPPALPPLRGSTPPASSPPGIAAPPERSAQLPRGLPPPRPPIVPGHVIVFDLETQKLAEEVGGWDNKRAMRMSVGCVYDIDAQAFRDYREEEVADLIADLAAAKLVVGFNIKSFDYEVLTAYAPRAVLEAVPTLDLLEKVRDTLKRRVRLDDLAKATLGQGKIADGLDAVRWFRAGEFDRLIEYCRHDVIVTKDLYEFGRTHGHVLFPSIQGVMKLPAGW